MKSELLHKFVCRCINKSGFVRDDGRLISRRQIKVLSRQIFNNIDQNQYNKLLSIYWHEEEIRKARENEELFIRMALRLRLDRLNPMKILDIGGKAATFAFICKSLGHEAWTTDLGEMLTRSPNKELFELFDVPAFEMYIKPNELLPYTGRKYDLITGFRTRFHSRYTWETGLTEEIHWGPLEWNFLLCDLAKNHLAENGRIFFMLNRLQERGAGGIIPNIMRDYFSSVGGELDGAFLKFNDLKKLRNS